MSKSKKYFYDGDQIYESNETTDASTLANEILTDSELPQLEEIIVGCWGESYDNSVQDILEMFCENKEKFNHIKKLFIGDMEYEECEVSWIEQGDYDKLLKSLPNLTSLTIKGSNDLSLGDIEHNNLQELEIICGGLPKKVINQITNAKLPKLKKLNLYIGIEDYGFDGNIEDIKALMNSDIVKNLEYLGLCDSEIQDEIVEEFLKIGNLHNIKVLDFSKGTLTDKGGQALLDNKDLLQKLDTLDLTYHYLSNDMMKKLEGLGIKVILDEQNEADKYDGEMYYYPMLTE